MFELEANCCKNKKNRIETMRRVENNKEYVWVKCLKCNQTFLLTNDVAKNSSRVMHGQEI